MIIIISILSILLLIAVAIIINLLIKNEKLEDMVNKRDEFISSFQETVKFTNEKLKEIDNKGTFQSDDEVGFFFKKLQALQEILNSYFKL